MKKIYVTPATSILNIELTHILAGSPNKLPNDAFELPIEPPFFLEGDIDDAV